MIVILRKFIIHSPAARAKLSMVQAHLIKVTISILLFGSMPTDANPKPASHGEPISPTTIFELFTSQGCSSCPPADKYLGELANHPENITIACHVTYWDYLGWKDSFSNAFCDKRQRIYNSYLKTGTNYTPQIIINGRYQGVGSRRQRIANMLYRTKKDPALKALAIDRHNDQLHIDLSKLTNKRSLELVVLGLGKTQEVAINRGENKNRRLTYHNPLYHGVIRELHNDTPNNYLEDIRLHSDIQHWVVLAQSIESGAIVAAGQIKIE